MPAKIELETILRIIKLKVENPSWGWRKIGKKAEVSWNTVKYYCGLYEMCDKEPPEGIIQKQHCKKCKIIYKHATYNTCPICKGKLKIKAW